ncbi:unnamed protein product [Vitrella brassicaformis CCMP3155]|uniref:Transmembrane protein 234 n=1 Tax=Vitrella brassicaformis (strain CCMP3155) TaxID=1169540 RepID=A0A0G4H2R2_VITBC|nr:unnamed protein product [Vitrella brassicaformis CCMP3155]|eukprot:CEM37966.1 unnamed protein product [Vitrella brassicaformis CCMP3155]
MRAALLLVGAIWGVTSPFLQCNDTHDTSPQGEHILKRTLRLLTNTKFIVPYLLNQVGSVLYYFLLRDYKLPVAVPLANSLSFLFTYITEVCLDTQLLQTFTDPVGLAGALLIVTGAAVCLQN